jgi:hypothetical protein
MVTVVDFNGKRCRTGTVLTSLPVLLRCPTGGGGHGHGRVKRESLGQVGGLLIATRPRLSADGRPMPPSSGNSLHELI